MDDIEKLKHAIGSIPGKRAVAKIHKLMPLIDERVREGISHQEIVETLNKNGFPININTFRTVLYRYRKSLGRKPSPTLPIGDENHLPEQASANKFDDMLDPKKRDELGEKYLHQKPPLLKNKRSNNT